VARAEVYLHAEFHLDPPTVWPQYTNVTDRRTGQDRQDRQRSDSIGRTVLETVAQKYTIRLLKPHYNFQFVEFALENHKWYSGVTNTDEVKYYWL